MIGLNEYVQRRVITQRGIQPIEDIVPGDQVYEYGTNKLLTVKKVIQSPCHELFSIRYTDRRVDICGAEDFIYAGRSIIQAKRAIKEIPFYEIELHPVTFNPGRIRRPLDPDPYVAGALLTYGDYNEKYLNLPADRWQVNNAFAHRYNVDYFPHITKDKVYFQWKGKVTDHKLTWEEFFPNYDFYAKTKKVSDPPFPMEYLFASHENRRQFIRGVFDMGYDKERYPNEISISLQNEDRLKWVQWILWSLGIPSDLYWDSLKSCVYSTYTLMILGPLHQYPGFFYDIDFIEESINMNNRVSARPKFVFKIDRFEPVQRELKYTQGYTKNLLLEQPHRIYLSDNFLPRVSL